MKRVLKLGGRGFSHGRDFQAEREALQEEYGSVMQEHAARAAWIMNSDTLSNAQKAEGLRAVRAKINEDQQYYSEQMQEINAAEIEEYGEAGYTGSEYGTAAYDGEAAYTGSNQTADESTSYDGTAAYTDAAQTADVSTSYDGTAYAADEKTEDRSASYEGTAAYTAAEKTADASNDREEPTNSNESGYEN